VSLLPDISQKLILALSAVRCGITFIPFTPAAPLNNALAAVKAHKAKALVVPDLLSNRDYINELYAAIPELDIQRRDFPTPFTPLQYPSLKYALLWSPEKKEYHGFIDINHFPVERPPFRSPLPKMASIPNDKPALFLPQKDTLNFDVVSQATLVNTGHFILEALSVTIQDRISFAVPYNSIGYYLAVGSISHGVVLIQAGKAFDAQATLKTISRDKATILFVEVSNLAQLLTASSKSKQDLSTLHTVVVVGRLDANVAQQAAQLGAKRVFGIEYVNEHSGQLTGVIYTAAGKAVPLPGVEAKVVDAQDKIVPIGVKGVLKTKGTHVLQSSNASDGWLNTNIQAQMDANGVFSL